MPFSGGGVGAETPGQTFVVQAGASIKTFLDGITDSSPTKPYVVEVFPGIFAEDPFTVPAHVSLVGVGGHEVTRIEANTPTSPLATLLNNAKIKGFHISGADGVGGQGVNVSGGGPC